MRIFFLKNVILHFQNIFVPTFFMLSMLSSRMKHKKAIENRTLVYFCLQHEFKKKMHFGAYLLLCGIVSRIFTIFFRGLEVCMAICDSYINLAIKKINKDIILREIFKRTYCPPIGTLALLLFLITLIHIFITFSLFTLFTHPL